MARLIDLSTPEERQADKRKAKERAEREAAKRAEAERWEAEECKFKKEIRKGNIDLRPFQQNRFIAAWHEAGHALGYYLTAAEMGYSPEESIISIEIISPEEMKCTGIDDDGTPEFLPEATTDGPSFSKELMDVYTSVITRENIIPNSKGEIMVDEETKHRLSTQALSEAKDKAIDIEKWLRASVLISVMGPVIEAVITKQSIDDIINCYECEDDIRDIVTNCDVAGVRDQFEEYMDTAIEQALDHLSKPEINNAVDKLAAHVFRNDKTDGKTAVRIIEAALQEVPEANAV